MTNMTCEEKNVVLVASTLRGGQGYSTIFLIVSSITWTPGASPRSGRTRSPTVKSSSSVYLFVVTMQYIPAAFAARIKGVRGPAAKAAASR